jgi:hypothetical protein
VGTRSTINIENADGTVTSMYCHWDGYISHHGPILLNFYETEVKVRALLELGSLSVLGKEIGKKHDFDKPPREADEWCRSHLRDRGEKDAVTKDFESIPAIDGEEFNYIFRLDGKWYVDRSEDSEDDPIQGWRELVPEVVALKLTS